VPAARCRQAALEGHKDPTTLRFGGPGRTPGQAGRPGGPPPLRFGDALRPWKYTRIPVRASGTGPAKSMRGERPAKSMRGERTRPEHPGPVVFDGPGELGAIIRRCVSAGPRACLSWGSNKVSLRRTRDPGRTPGHTFASLRVQAGRRPEAVARFTILRSGRTA